MTITIRPRNMEIVKVKEDCLCTSYMASGMADPSCLDCNGTGTMMAEQYAHSLKLANSRFNIIWNALGLDTMDGFGEIDPNVLFTAIQNYIPGLAEVEGGWYIEGDQPDLCTVLVGESHPGPKVWMGGMNAAAVDTRLNMILKLAKIASQKNDVIVWD
jgi:hypothetical protein